MLNYIYQKIVKIEKSAQRNYDLINENSLGLSGVCAVFVQPKKDKDLLKIVKLCLKYKIKYFVLGFGTNVMVLKQGFSGVVVSTKHILKTLKCSKNKIIAGAGVGLFKLNDYAVNNSLSGLEFCYGIPGSVGGAIYMNAGAYGTQMSDIVAKITYFDGQKIKRILNKSCEFEYRNSIFAKKNYLILKGEFKLYKDVKNNIIQKNQNYLKIRKKTQPYFAKSAGSVFKRCGEHVVSKLIDEMGFKGVSVGGAMVSTIHAGFIINFDNATSDDVLKLIEIISKKVAKTHQIDLQLELKLLGDLDENIRGLPHAHSI